MVVDALEQRLDDVAYVAFLGKIQLLAAAGDLLLCIYLTALHLCQQSVSLSRNGVSHGIKAVLFAHLLVN